MGKLLVTIGTSLSGKTTWAKDYLKNNKKTYYVSRDAERESLFGEYRQGNKKEENIISDIVKQKVKYGLMLGDVVLDNTHIKQKYIDNVVKTHPNTDIEFKVFPLLDKEVLNSRNKKRFKESGKFIPEHVLDNQIKSFKSLTIPENIYHRGLKVDSRIKNKKGYKKELSDCIIIDLDGTLSLMNGRSAYSGKDCGSDLINTSVAGLINLYFDYKVVFIFSGRNSDNGGEDATRKWLKDQGVVFDRLVMREEGDYRADTIIKKEMYDKYIKDKYNVHFVLDDRKCVVDMWRSIGLDCFQVYEGDF